MGLKPRPKAPARLRLREGDRVAFRIGQAAVTGTITSTALRQIGAVRVQVSMGIGHVVWFDIDPKLTECEKLW